MKKQRKKSGKGRPAFNPLLWLKRRDMSDPSVDVELSLILPANEEVHNLQFGQLTRDGFTRLGEIVALTAYLLHAITAHGLGDAEVNDALRLAGKDIDRAGEVMQGLGERFAAKGIFVAKSDELNVLKRTVGLLQEFLKVVPTGMLLVAMETAQADLHRNLIKVQRGEL